MIKKIISLIVMLTAMLCFTGISTAELLNNELHYPMIACKNAGTTLYNASTGTLSIAAEPVAIFLEEGGMPYMFQPNGLLSITVTLSENGMLTGGDPVVLKGTVQLGAEGTKAGILLTQYECDGKLKAIVLKYVGGSCNDSSNWQSGKFQCTGNAGIQEPVRIVMTEDSDKVSVVSNDSNITIGDEFALVADKELRAETKFKIVKGGNILQQLNIHTSCSKPLSVGDRFGSMEVVALDLKDGDYVSAGSDVEFTYLIKNEGTVPVKNITVEDSVLGPVPGSPISILNPGQTILLETTELIMNTTSTTVVADGITELGTACTASASSTVTVVVQPIPDTKHDKNKDDKKKHDKKKYGKKKHDKKNMAKRNMAKRNMIEKNMANIRTIT